jgi:hypothetical protein
MRIRVWRVAALGASIGVWGLVVSSPAWAVVGSHPIPTYQTNGRVQVIVVSGSTVYIGGQFTAVRPAGAAAGTNETTRNRAAAFDTTTGALLPWNPNASGPVRAIAPVGSTVYLGGAFTKVGGKGRNRLAAVDATSGAVAAWNPGADALVLDFGVDAGTLYAGGGFATAGGSARANLAAFSTTTGALTSWAPSADGQVKALELTADSSEVIVGGDFTHIDGTSQNHIAALSPSTGAPLSWAKHLSYSVIDLAADTSGVYASGSGGGGNFAAFNPATGAQLWIGGTNGNVQAVAAVGGVVYFGGHFDTYCGQRSGQHTCDTPTPRKKLLAVDEATGALLPWDPSANSTLGIFALTGDSATGDLFAGGDFTSIGQRNQQGYAQFTP